MNASERDVDERYKADGWTAFSTGWPDRAYVRMKEGKLEVKFVEIKSPNDVLRPDQELMHEILRSQGLNVQIEPVSKAPKNPSLPLEALLKAAELLKKHRETLENHASG
jgi:hypothetical protein